MALFKSYENDNISIKNSSEFYNSLSILSLLMLQKSYFNFFFFFIIHFLKKYARSGEAVFKMCSGINFIFIVVILSLKPILKVLSFVLGNYIMFIYSFRKT